MEWAVQVYAARPRESRQLQVTIFPWFPVFACDIMRHLGERLRSMAGSSRCEPKLGDPILRPSEYSISSAVGVQRGQVSMFKLLKLSAAWIHY